MTTVSESSGPAAGRLEAGTAVPAAAAGSNGGQQPHDGASLSGTTSPMNIYAAGRVIRQVGSCIVVRLLTCGVALRLLRIHNYEYAHNHMHYHAHVRPVLNSPYAHRRARSSSLVDSLVAGSSPVSVGGQQAVLNSS